MNVILIVLPVKAPVYASSLGVHRKGWFWRQELNGSLGEMTGQRGYGDDCRCMEGVDFEECKCFLVQAILTKKRLICSTVAFSLLPPPSMESFNHVGAVKFQPWNGAFVQSFWRLPWSAGSFSCPFFYFFLNGFFVRYWTPLPSLASVSDTIKGIGKDAGPAPARL